MSAAAGAPPPPPPPPPSPPKSSFDSLPAELLLNIIRFLRIDDYVKFALAVYPILEFHGLVPPLTPEIYRRITQPPPNPAFPRSLEEATRWPDGGGGAQSTNGGGSSNESKTNTGLPVELNLQIMEYLEPADRIAWIFSHRAMFWRFLPALSEETKKRLWDAVQKSKK